MPIVYEPTIYCDECGTKKGVTNHWMSFLVKNGVSCFYKFSDLPSIKNNKNKIHIYCGQNCISKAFQRLLDTGSLEKIENILPEVIVITESETEPEILIGKPENDEFESSARLISTE